MTVKKRNRPDEWAPTKNETIKQGHGEDGSGKGRAFEAGRIPKCRYLTFKREIGAT